MWNDKWQKYNFRRKSSQIFPWSSHCSSNESIPGQQPQVGGSVDSLRRRNLTVSTRTEPLMEGSWALALSRALTTPGGPAETPSCWPDIPPRRRWSRPSSTGWALAPGWWGRGRAPPAPPPVEPGPATPGWSPAAPGAPPRPAPPTSWTTLVETRAPSRFVLFSPAV